MLFVCVLVVVVFVAACVCLCFVYVVKRFIVLLFFWGCFVFLCLCSVACCSSFFRLCFVGF